VATDSRERIIEIADQVKQARERVRQLERELDTLLQQAATKGSRPGKVPQPKTAAKRPAKQGTNSTMGRTYGGKEPLTDAVVRTVNAEPDRVFSVKEIAKILDRGLGTTTAACARLVTAGKIAKIRPYGYRAGSGVVMESSKKGKETASE